MLVATRDPLPQPGPHDRAPAHPAVPHASSGASRLMFVLQLAGSMLAIPVGLASGYSIYRANFSPETACQALRANIVGMIDKQIDASTRRMLVRHDVETFEKTCGAFDPDAEAAFKRLLATETAPVRAVGPVAKHAETPVKAEARAEPAKEVRKLELRAAVPPEPVHEMPKERSREIIKEAAKPAAAERTAQQHDAMSDTRWLEAVRGALVAHETTASTEAPAEKSATRGTPPHPLAVMPVAEPVAATPVAAAPALPPPTSISEPAGAEDAASHAADPDRLVPPAPIPDQDRPKPSGWLSHVPFVGQALAR